MSDFEIIKTPPFVRVIGYSQPVVDNMQEYFQYRGVEPNIVLDNSPELIAEFAGRICYQSFHNPKRSTRTEYLQNSLIAHGHGSVLEHPTLNFVVADVPRSVQLELVRHRAGMAYSFESQRFTSEAIRFIVPPLLRGNEKALQIFRHQSAASYYAYVDLMETTEIRIRELGLWGEDRTLRRKRARESARSVLGNCVGSDGVVTMNTRALRHILAMRSDEHADASIREFSFAMYEQVAKWLPAILDDLEELPVQFGPDALVFEHRKV
jgi:thymidylate synthase (FAD)